MFLALDVGNTQTSFGVFREGALLHHWVTETRNAKTADQIAAFLLPLLQYHQIEGEWDSVGLCSVVPSVNPAFDKLCQHYFKCSPIHIGPDLPLPFSLNVKEPLSVGADRLANVAYAIDRMSLPALVVDFGTATTIDAISTSGAYEGGAILPGIGLSLEALSKRTAQLPLVDAQFPKQAIGKTTSECIQSGVLLGYGDQISGLLRRSQKELGGVAEIVLTGGFSPLFKTRLSLEASVHPNLTLEGIEILSRQLLGRL